MRRPNDPTGGITPAPAVRGRWPWPPADRRPGRPAAGSRRAGGGWRGPGRGPPAPAWHPGARAGRGADRCPSDASTPAAAEGRPAPALLYDGDADRTVDELAGWPAAARGRAPADPSRRAEAAGRRDVACARETPPASPPVAAWLVGSSSWSPSPRSASSPTCCSARRPTRCPTSSGSTEADARRRRPTSTGRSTSSGAQRRGAGSGHDHPYRPAAGERLAEGEPFLVVVSEGPEFRALPDVAGAPLAEAETALAELSLTSPADRSDRRDVPAGSVISWSVPTDPSLAAGDEVLPDTEVALVVSTGPAPRTVPDARQPAVDQATAALAELRLVPRSAEARVQRHGADGQRVVIRPRTRCPGRAGTSCADAVEGIDLVPDADLDRPDARPGGRPRWPTPACSVG